MTDLYFVFLGDRLPRYAASSLSLSQRYSGVSINLIGENRLGKNIKDKGVTFIPLEDFYCREQFGNASTRITSSPNFRGGFWQKSLERIFVLEQFMSASRQTSLLHAELDQILFRVDHLVDTLGLIEHKGLFTPFHDSHRAVASVIFCNNPDSLSSLTEMAANGDVFENEMVLISRWAGRNPQQAFALPTMADIYASKRGELHPGLRTLSLEQTGGFVDAAQLGQWVAGIDPRNVPIGQRARTKWVDSSDGDLLGEDQLGQIRFRLDETTGNLTVGLEPDGFVPLYNLHFHSKIHPWLQKRPQNLAFLLTEAGRERTLAVPGGRATQLFTIARQVWKSFRARPHRAITRWLPKFFARSGLRPSSYPFVSGDGFRKLADHTWEQGTKTLRPDRVRAGDIIFCESDGLPDFERVCLPGITAPFVLLLGNSDFNHTAKNLKDTVRKKAMTVFAQNLVEPVAGVQILPIGLENAWRANHGSRLGFLIHRRTFQGRIPRIMWSFNVITNPTARVRCANALVKCSVADSLGEVSPPEHRKALTRYSFVACPPGNGLDTHRMWEALYLGCVPIVLRSELAEECKRLGLPVWIVDDYGELEEATEGDLRRVAGSLKVGFTNPALWHVFWKQKIASAAAKLRSPV